MAIKPIMERGGNSAPASECDGPAMSEVLGRTILAVLAEKGPMENGDLSDEVWRHLQTAAASPPSVLSAVRHLIRRRLVVRDFGRGGVVTTRLTDRGLELVRHRVPV